MKAVVGTINIRMYPMTYFKSIKKIEQGGKCMNFSLVIVTFAAFLTPMLLARFHISFIPTTVAEIFVGILLGKSGFNIVENNAVLSTISTLGVVLLLFLSGMEIDFSLFKKPDTSTPLAARQAENTSKETPLKVASLAYGLTVVGSVLLAVLFCVSGFFSDVQLASILFSTVALGIVIPVLKENELLGRTYGQTLLLFAVLGEVVPLLGLTIYSSLKSGNISTLWFTSLIFLVAVLLLLRFRNFFTVFKKYTKSTTQLDVRLAFVVIITLVVLAETVGAENVLGAFLAGIVIKLLEPEKETEEKLDAIGYGYFIPFFFILTGVKLDLVAMFSSAETLVLIPLFLIAFLLAKLPAYFIFRRLFTTSNALSGVFLSQTTLTLILPALNVAENLNVIDQQQSGAFLLSGILTCLIGPLLFKYFYKSHEEVQKKIEVHFIGVGLMAISAMQELSSTHYSKAIYTNDQYQYDTYHNKAQLSLLESLDSQHLIFNRVFDTDVLVLAHQEANINFDLALKAKEYGVPRVIVRLDVRDPKERLQMEENLAQAEVEFFSMFDVNVGMLRSAIEAPAFFNVLTSTQFRLNEVTVTNAKYEEKMISQLPEVNEVIISRIFRNHEPIIPHGTTRLELGDHLIMSGSNEAVEHLRNLLEANNE
ncbi:putative Na(+)/H(+) antiporter [Tetragenococcus halophilus subsp. flandriensis]|nr:putative Na(+)/H(+) antiporter [Tetragenococcus halophilus subsp. flandriensis]